MSLETLSSSNIAKNSNCRLKGIKAFEEAQPAGSNLVDKDYAPKLEDFDHRGFDFSPNEGYLDHKVDYVHGRVDIDLP